MPRRARSFAQGDLDGLCGVYSIINAIWAAGLSAVPEHDELRKACRRLTGQRAEDLFGYLTQDVLGARGLRPVLVDGIAGPLLSRLLRAAGRWLAEHCGIAVVIRRPFYHRRNVSTARLVACLKRHLGNPYAAVIVGGDEPWSHWTVVREVTRSRLLLLDSGNHGHVPLQRGTRHRRYHAGLVVPNWVFLVTLTHADSRQRDRANGRSPRRRQSSTKR